MYIVFSVSKKYADFEMSWFKIIREFVGIVGAVSSDITGLQKMEELEGGY